LLVYVAGCVLCPKLPKNKQFFFRFLTRIRGSRGSVFGMTTGYGPGIESQWGARIYAPVQADSEAHPTSYAMVTVSFPGVRAGAWRWSPTPSSAEVKERVEQYLYSSLGLPGLFVGEFYIFDVLTSNVSFIRVPKTEKCDVTASNRTHQSTNSRRGHMT
jgi:hypothetical protein